MFNAKFTSPDLNVCAGITEPSPQRDVLESGLLRSLKTSRGSSSMTYVQYIYIYYTVIYPPSIGCHYV